MRFLGRDDEHMKILAGLWRRASTSLCGMAVLLGGCPARQRQPQVTRVVYVPAPAAAPAAAEPAGELVIEEPQPPAPPEAQAPEPETPATPKPTRRHRRANPAGQAMPPDAADVSPDTDETPPSTEVPALEPRSSREQESSLRGQALAVQSDVQQKVTRLEAANLNAADRKTLDDARTFLAQSRKALEEGDLPRSLNLARKALLLASALAKE